MKTNSDRDRAGKTLNARFALFVLAALSGACSGALDAGDGSDGQESLDTGQLAATGTHGFGAKRDSAQLIASKLRAFAPLSAPLPSSYDMTSDVPPPGDQGQQNSCTGWAVAYATKSHEEVVEKGWSPFQKRYQFSASWLYNQVNGGVDGGASVGTAMQLIVNKGADTSAFFPYDPSNFTKQPDSVSATRSWRFRVNDWSILPNSVEAFKQSLTQRTPVVVAFWAMDDFMNLSSSNPIYDTASSPKRAGHAVALIGYDDAKRAFKLINSWGTSWGIGGYGWLGYDFINDFDLSLTAYVMDDAPTTPPPVTNSLYAINSDAVWRADNDFGDWAGVNFEDWSGETSMAALNGSLYAVAGQRLRKLNPDTGAFTFLGNTPWIEHTEMAALGSSLYIAENTGLWKVNPTNGAYTRLGTQTWTNVTSMAGIGSNLYVIASERLYRVNASTGARTVLGASEVWDGETSMAVVGTSLYIQQDSGIWKVSTSNGTYTLVGTRTWWDTTGMASLDGKLYLAESDNLYEVNLTTGQPEQLGESDAWPGSTVLVALP